MAKRNFLVMALACTAACALAPGLTSSALAATATTAAAPKAAAAAPKAAATKTSSKAATPYKPARLSDGHPDLQGGWSNSTLTQAARPAQYGNRLIMTEAEVAEIEGRNNALIAAGNEPTPVNATVAEVSAKADCSGNRGTNCNYNAAFTDPGTTVMRVGGQGRTSLLTTPDGRDPAPKNAAAAGRAGRASAVAAAADGEGEGEGPPARGGRGGGGGAAAAGGAAAPAAAFGTRQGDRGAGVPGITRGPAYENPETRGNAERCILSFGRSAGPPMFSQLYNSNYQFVQGKDTVAIWAEMVHDVRVIRIGGTHRTDGLRPYFGDSIGHWDGDTLVVETTNIPQSQAYQGSWQNLTVTEKFKRVSPTRMDYQFTIHDPTMWDADWGGEYEFAKAEPPYEYACHEGNYALEDVLAGARAADAADKDQQASATRR